MSNLQDPRVLFAAERTLLAWIRTSLGFIAFGFVIERSGLLLAVVLPPEASPNLAVRTFWIGMAFIILGIGAVIFSSRQHMAVLKTLNPLEIPRGYATKGALTVNVAVALLGLMLAVGLYINHS